MTDYTQTKKIRSVFTVKRKEVLTPHLIRVVFGLTDEQVVLLLNIRDGSNNKLFIPIEDVNASHVGVSSFGAKEGSTTTIRTYTNRRIDLKSRELSVDFVAHGDAGPASTWARHATPGDLLEIGMKDNNRDIVPQADAYLLVGDATALPVISAILEQLPLGIEVKAIVEVYGEADQMPLSSDADLTVDWLHNAHPEQGSGLSDTIKNFQFAHPTKNNYVYIAAENATVKELRHYFKTTLEWNPHMMYTCSYWKAGESEDKLAATR